MTSLGAFYFILHSLPSYTQDAKGWGKIWLRKARSELQEAEREENLTIAKFLFPKAI